MLDTDLAIVREQPWIRFPMCSRQSRQKAARAGFQPAGHDE
jgi:hypothetical protein